MIGNCARMVVMAKAGNILPIFNLTRDKNFFLFSLYIFVPPIFSIWSAAWDFIFQAVDLFFTRKIKKSLDISFCTVYNKRVNKGGTKK